MSRWGPPTPTPPRPSAEILRAEMQRLVSGPVMFRRLPPKVARHMLEVQKGGKPWGDDRHHTNSKMWRDE